MHANEISDSKHRFILSLNNVPACQRWETDTDWFPSVDVSEVGEDYLFEVDLPGLTLAEVNMSVQGDLLSISGTRFPRHHDRKTLRGERPSGAFVRRFRLPPDTRRDAMDATFQNGVLELRVPRSRPEDETSKFQAIAFETNNTK